MILDGHVAQTGFENTTKTIEKYYNHGNMLYHKMHLHYILQRKKLGIHRNFLQFFSEKL